MTTYNTGNPIGSKDPRDLYDNAENLDEAVNSSADTFKDRLGNSRLTWAGIEKAGTGDPGEIVPIVQQAVQDVVDGVDGQVAVAQSAAVQAGIARDAAFINADVYPYPGAGRPAVEDGEQFQVIENAGRDAVRYKRLDADTQEEVARFPTSLGLERATNRTQYGLITSLNEYPIKVDTVAKTIELAGMATGTNSSTFVPEGTTISYEGLNTTVLLVVSPGPSVGFYTYGQLPSLDSTHIIIGSLMSTRNHFQSMSNYMIDGVGSSYANEVDRLSIGYAASFDEDPIQLNTVNKTLTVKGNTRVYAGSREFRTAEELVYDYSGLGSNLAIVVSEDGSVDLISPALLKDIKDFSVMIGLLVPSRDLILGAPNYSVNGYSNYANNPVTPPNPPSGEGRVIPSLGWSLDGVYSAPEQEARPGREIRIADIYGWFDELVADHPDYVTKTLLGNEPTGLPIYEYRFKPITSKDSNAETPRIMIHAGVHAEAMSLIMPYRAMRAICEDWESEPLLEALRFGVEISVIPAVSPYGIETGNRYNSNDVNINRNYPQSWQSTGPHIDKPGPAPLSEIETQISYGMMQEFDPHIFIDVHNFGTETSGEHRGAFLWFPPVGNYLGEQIGAALINRMARKWATEHSWTTPTAEELSRNYPLPMFGGAGVQGASMFPIGITFETGSQILGEPDGGVYSPLALKYATESLINYLIIALRRIA